MNELSFARAAWPALPSVHTMHDAAYTCNDHLLWGSALQDAQAGRRLPLLARSFSLMAQTQHACMLEEYYGA